MEIEFSDTQAVGTHATSADAHFEWVWLVDQTLS